MQAPNSPKNLSNELHSNLSLAQEVNRLTHTIIKESPSHPKQNEKGATARKALKEKLEHLRQDSDPKKPLETYTIRHFYRLVKLAQENHIGNCDEYAAIAAHLFREKIARDGLPQLNVEIFSLHYKKETKMNGAHAFVVIGRDPDSNSKDPRTWGRSAVVCDPWDNKVYPAKQMYEATHIWFVDEAFLNRVEPINLDKQFLHVDLDIKSLEFYDFLEKSIFKLTEIAKLTTDALDILNKEVERLASKIDKQKIIQQAANFLDMSFKDMLLDFKRRLEVNQDRINRFEGVTNPHTINIKKINEKIDEIIYTLIEALQISPQDMNILQTHSNFLKRAKRSLSNNNNTEVDLMTTSEQALNSAQQILSRATSFLSAPENNPFYEPGDY